MPEKVGTVSEAPVYYCHRCGERLSVVLVSPRVKSYDVLTGFKKMEMKIACPNDKWWLFHDVYWLENGGKFGWHISSRGD